MEEHQKFEKIEDFLAGRLKGKELEEFKKQLETDGELISEVNMHKELTDFLPATPKNQFRNTLSGIRDTVDTPAVRKDDSLNGKKWWLGIGLILIIGIGSLFFFDNKPEVQAEIDDNSNPILNQEEKASDIPPAAELEDSKKEVVPESTKKEPVKTPTETRQKPIKKPRPIAADFSVNPLIEAEMGDLVRGSKIEVLLENPSGDAKWSLSKGNASINFTGVLDTDEALANIAVRLLLFDNKKETYENWQPVWEQEVDLKEVDGKFQFSIIENLKLKPGLYYYIFEDVNEEMYLKIGKARIEG